MILGLAGESRGRLASRTHLNKSSWDTGFFKRGKDARLLLPEEALDLDLRNNREEEGKDDDADDNDVDDEGGMTKLTW